MLKRLCLAKASTQQKQHCFWPQLFNWVLPILIHSLLLIQTLYQSWWHSKNKFCQYCFPGQLFANWEAKKYLFDLAYDKFKRLTVQRQHLPTLKRRFKTKSVGFHSIMQNVGITLKEESLRLSPWCHSQRMTKTNQWEKQRTFSCATNQMLIWYLHYLLLHVLSAFIQVEWHLRLSMLKHGKKFFHVHIQVKSYASCSLQEKKYSFNLKAAVWTLFLVWQQYLCDRKLLLTPKWNSICTLTVLWCKMFYCILGFSLPCSPSPSPVFITVHHAEPTVLAKQNHFSSRKILSLSLFQKVKISPMLLTMFIRIQ